jgi:hypothetical protein
MIPIVAALIYIPPNSVKGSPPLHPHPHQHAVIFLMTAILTEGRWALMSFLLSQYNVICTINIH